MHETPQETYVLDVLTRMETRDLTTEQFEVISKVRTSIIEPLNVQTFLDTLSHLSPGAGPYREPEDTDDRADSAWVEVVNGPANVRTGPSIDHPRFMLAPRGFLLQAIAKVGNWYQVIVSGQSGFIHATLVHEVQAPGKEPDALMPSAPRVEQREIADSLNEASETFANRFEGPWSFGCLDEHQKCRAKHAWYDCDLIMLSCIGESWLRAF